MLPSFSSDGYQTGHPPGLRGGGAFIAVATGRPEGQEGGLGQHFQQRKSVSAPKAVQGGGGPGCRAEGTARLGP